MPKKELQRRIDDNSSDRLVLTGAPGTPATNNHAHQNTGDGGVLATYARSTHDHAVGDIQEFLVDPDLSVGLQAFVYGGIVRDDTGVSIIADASYSLTDDENNYIEISSSLLTVVVNTTGFTSGNIPLGIVVTASGAVTTVVDRRAFFVVSYGSSAVLPAATQPDQALVWSGSAWTPYGFVVADEDGNIVTSGGDPAWTTE